MARKPHLDTPQQSVHRPTIRAPQAIPIDVAIRRVRGSEIDSALRLLFGSPTTEITLIRRQIDAFRRIARSEGYDLKRQMVLLHRETIVAACCFVPQDGGTAFVFTSLPPVQTELFPLMLTAHQQMAQWAFNEGSNLLQILLEPEDLSRRDLCRAAGYEELTELLYLRRHVDHPPLTIALSDSIRWTTYTPDRHEQFKSVIAQTYEKSLDCPELTGMRDMEQVVRSHKSAGRFDPDCWFLMLQNDRPVGVLLLSPLNDPDAMELTYMGLTPAARSGGLGAQLLAHAIDRTRRAGRETLTLAVDCRNTPAIKLYRFFGFETLFPRRVLIRSRTI